METVPLKLQISVRCRGRARPDKQKQHINRKLAGNEQTSLVARCTCTPLGRSTSGMVSVLRPILSTAGAGVVLRVPKPSPRTRKNGSLRKGSFHDASEPDHSALVCSRLKIRGPTLLAAANASSTSVQDHVTCAHVINANAVT